MIFVVDKDTDLFVAAYSIFIKIFGTLSYSLFCAQNIAVCADEDSVAKGFIGWKVYGGNNIEITNLAVVEAYRNIGVGTSLMNWIKEMYRGYVFSLNVSVHNYSAIRLYEKLGLPTVVEYTPEKEQVHL